MTKQQLQKKLIQYIPIAKEFDFTIQTFKKEKIILKAKLSKNRNHKGTAFGGSQFSLCALAAYGLIFDTLNKNSFDTDNIVIADGRIKYLRPVAKDFLVVCEIKNQEKLRICKDLFDHGTARLTVKAAIYVNKKTCSHFRGVFVCKV